MSSLKIAVLGAGVVGLTTALELQNEFRNAEITIISENFETYTTSSVAAGLFRCTYTFRGPTEYLTNQWIENSYNYWDNLKFTEDVSVAGIAQISGYMFSNISHDNVRNPLIEKVVPIYRKATEAELRICNGEWKYGSFFTTLLVDCNLYLPWATDKFSNTGGKIKKETVTSWNNIDQYYDAIINCTGLGAKWLCNDYKLIPVRGQVLKVHAPWLKMFIYGDNDTYIIPGFNSVTLGGSRHFDSSNLNVCPYDSEKIRTSCEYMLPSLKTSPTLEVRVGLRPYRDIVRIEKETISSNGKTLKIVHNYGHGGFGVSTAPGTAKHAVKLVKEILLGNSKL